MPTPRQQPAHSSEYVSLKEHFDARLAAIEKAQDMTCKAMEKRLDGMNEIREAMRDQADEFMTKNESAILHKAIEADIRSLRESRAELAGKASQASVNLAQVLSAIALVISLATFILKLLGAG